MSGALPFYDVPAEGYDELYGEEQTRKYTAVFRELVHFSQETRVVLDVGCATGLLANFLELMGFKSLYVGIDLAADRLRIAKSRSQLVMVVQADAHALPIRSGAADLTACFTVIHLMNPGKAVRELARVSRSTAIITLLRKKLDLKPAILKLLRKYFRGWALKILQPTEEIKDEVYILVRSRGEKARKDFSGQQSLRSSWKWRGLPNILQPEDHHSQSLNPYRKSAMRRRTIPEMLGKPSEVL